LQFAAMLKSAGVGAGDIVLIITRHSVDAHAMFIGAMMYGAIPSFLPHPSGKQDAALYWRQHHVVFAHIKPAAIIVHEDFHDAVAEAVADTGAVVMKAGDVEAHQPFVLEVLPAGDSIALLQHSSGTTGLKKGVQLSFEIICRQLSAYCAAIRIDDVAEPRITSWLPLYRHGADQQFSAADVARYSDPLDRSV
jgi:fatty-acyl-CoA synthase